MVYEIDIVSNPQRGRGPPEGGPGEGSFPLVYPYTRGGHVSTVTRTSITPYNLYASIGQSAEKMCAK